MHLPVLEFTTRKAKVMKKAGFTEEQIRTVLKEAESGMKCFVGPVSFSTILSVPRVENGVYS